MGNSKVKVIESYLDTWSECVCVFVCLSASVYPQRQIPSTF